jgi:hypothetical protein
MHETEPRSTDASDDQREESLRLREEILELRDALLGAEAQLAEALGRMRILEDEVLRHQVLERLMNSRTGRLLQSYYRLRARLRERS